MPTYYCILTAAGQADLAAAQAAGIAVALDSFAVGDANGAYYEPAEDQSALVNEVWRGNINRVYVAPNNPNYLVVEALIPADQGGFDIREAGIFNAAGDLFAVGKYPLTTKPAPGSGSEKDLYVRMVMQITNAQNVAQTIDPSVALATIEYVDSRNWRTSVRVATTGNITLAGGAPDTVDGVAVAEGDRVLVKAQTAGAENGIYVVDTLGTGGDGTWVRAADADTSLEAAANMTVTVEEGTANADSLWMLTTNRPITLGTTALTFKRMIGKTGVAAGTYTSVTVDEEGRVTAGSDPTAVAATPNTVMKRDAAGRAKVTAPFASDDIARKAEADAVQENLNTHIGGESVHGATSAATANKIMKRDAAGRAKVAAPSASDDIARKDTVDAVNTAANVLSRIAEGTVGAVGTYALLYDNSNPGVTTHAGDIVSGSKLAYANARGNYEGIVSGSWQCMGIALPGATEDGPVSVFLRIA